jgi:ABC-type lipoprotein release transport system permease subunit
MHTVLEIARTGLSAILLHPLRSLATTAAVIVVLVPYLVGLGISYGVQEEAELSIRLGPDLYVTGSRFGRDAPVPLAAVASIRDLDGVTDVVPRIVGGLALGKDRESAILVGIPLKNMPRAVHCISGRLPRAGSVNELVFGSGLARKLHLEVGSVLPPFYHNRKGEKLSRVVGIFRSDVSLWQTNLIFTTFASSAAIFDQPNLATGLLVRCRPGYAGRVADAIRGMGAFPSGAVRGNIRPHIIARQDLEAMLPAGLLHREGIFDLHFLLAFAVGILVVLVTSGFGLGERRREVGILKATGWQTDEVLLRGLVEALVLSVTAAAVSVLLAFVWLKGLNGWWIAGIFLAGAGVAPDFTVPFQLAPVPALLAFVTSFVVVLSGTAYSTWRAATVPPREALR